MTFITKTLQTPNLNVNLLFASTLQYYHIAINIDGAYSFEAEALT